MSSHLIVWIGIDPRRQGVRPGESVAPEEQWKQCDLAGTGGMATGTLIRPARIRRSRPYASNFLTTEPLREELRPKVRSAEGGANRHNRRSFIHVIRRPVRPEETGPAHPQASDAAETPSSTERNAVFITGVILGARSAPAWRLCSHRTPAARLAAGCAAGRRVTRRGATPGTISLTSLRDARERRRTAPRRARFETPAERRSAQVLRASGAASSL